MLLYETLRKICAKRYLILLTLTIGNKQIRTKNLPIISQLYFTTNIPVLLVTPEVAVG